MKNSLFVFLALCCPFFIFLHFGNRVPHHFKLLAKIDSSAHASESMNALIAEPASLKPLASSNIDAIWCNDGGDKITREELRAIDNPLSVQNSVWNGTGINLFGAKNEVVSFNLILEALSQASGVEVSLTSLNGTDGTIGTTPANGNGLFHFLGRHIELFYIKYLEIKGISTDLFFHGFNYDERHIPERCRRPYDESTGEGWGLWEDRPCHNTFFPEIAVPLELHTPFAIQTQSNQSIWGDIYIPKTLSPGTYKGTINVIENGGLTWQIPVKLHVRDFTLPDLPYARTMLYYSLENLNSRYFGQDDTQVGSPEHLQLLELADTHVQMAHRHKISVIDTTAETVEQMGAAWADRLSGDLFTAERGYDGIGIGTGNNVYSIGTYGSWSWQDGAKAEMWSHSDTWVNWFEAQDFTTPTDYFLYLIDESDDYSQIEQWANWIESNPGPGRNLMSLATIDLPLAQENTPALDIPTSWMSVGLTAAWQNAAAHYQALLDKHVYLYNSNRPATGSFAIEDEGTALRVLAWAQYKKNIDRWFYWESTYYDNYQGDMGPTNVFQTAHTFGSFDEIDPILGQTGWNYLNGDGVLFYPGTDYNYPSESYGLMGPFASLRLKHWRRGIQDVDYLNLAKAHDPSQTAAIVNKMIPQVLWEYGVTDPEDPTWVLTDVSWSSNPDDWESARKELADIIEGQGPGGPQAIATLNGFLSAGSTFADVIQNGYADTQWYKIWDQASGQYYIKGAAAASGHWVSADSLSQMELPYDLNKFFVTAWGPDNGQSEWVDFVVSIGTTDSTITLNDQAVDAYTTISYDAIIDTKNLDTAAYLRVYNGAEYLYLDASGDGWVKAEELGNYAFETGAAGDTIQIWVDTYLYGSGRSGWEDVKITAE
jgi:hypothetical protein